MEVCNFVAGFVAIVLVTLFSVLATRAEKAMWKKCDRRPCCRRLQQQITMGKSHCR